MLILIKLLLSNGNIGLTVKYVCKNLHFLKSGKIDWERYWQFRTLTREKTTAGTSPGMSVKETRHLQNAAIFKLVKTNFKAILPPVTRRTEFVNH